MARIQSSIYPVQYNQVYTQCNTVFLFQSDQEKEKVPLSNFHLECKALQWHQWWKKVTATNHEELHTRRYRVSHGRWLIEKLWLDPIQFKVKPASSPELHETNCRLSLHGKQGVDDLAFLHLFPYRQTFLARKDQGSHPTLLQPFCIIQWTDKLPLNEGSHSHPIFMYHALEIR